MSITIELEVAGELGKFRLQKGVERRLHDLLDKQDGSAALTSAERKEAEGLVNLAEMLSLLRVKVATMRRSDFRNAASVPCMCLASSANRARSPAFRRPSPRKRGTPNPSSARPAALLRDG